MNSKLQLSSIIVFFLISACAYGPQAERKSALNYLNGEHYQQAPELKVAGVPLLKGKEKLTSISGIVQFTENYLPQPIKGATISLIDPKKEIVIATDVSEFDGSFRIQEIIANGTYRILVRKGKLEKIRQIEISSYSIKDFIINLNSKRQHKYSFFR